MFFRSILPRPFYLTKLKRYGLLVRGIRDHLQAFQTGLALKITIEGKIVGLILMTKFQSVFLSLISIHFLHILLSSEYS
jgi:hypothetical protein